MPNCSLKKYNKTITNIIIIIKTSGLNFTLWCFRIVTTLLTVPQWFCYSSIHTYHRLKERWVFYVSWVLVPWIQHTVRCLERIPARISSLKATRKQVNIQLTACWEETRKVSDHLATNLCISPPKIYILMLIERKSLWKEFFHFNFTMKFKEVRFKWQY